MLYGLQKFLSKIQFYRDTDNAIVRDVIFIISSIVALCAYFQSNDSQNLSFISVSITQFVFSLSIIIEMMGVIKLKSRGIPRALAVFQIFISVVICGLSMFVISVENANSYYIDIRNNILIINLCLIILVAIVFFFDLTISCIFLSESVNDKPENHLFK